MEAMQGIIILGIGIGFASFVISEAYIFSWFRKWVAKKNEFLGDLFSCGMCVSVYLNAFAQCVYQSNPINIVPILDLIIVWWIMSLISTVVWLVLNIFFNLAGK